MDIVAYHVQTILHDLTRRISDDVEVTLTVFLGCAVLLYMIFGRGKRSL